MVALTFSGASYAQLLGSSSMRQDFNTTVSTVVCNYMTGVKMGYKSCTAYVDSFRPGSVVATTLFTLPTGVSPDQSALAATNLLAIINVAFSPSFIAAYGVTQVSGSDVTNSGQSPPPSSNLLLNLSLIVTIAIGIGAAVLIALFLTCVVLCCRRMGGGDGKVSPSTPPQGARPGGPTHFYAQPLPNNGQNRWHVQGYNYGQPQYQPQQFQQQPQFQQQQQGYYNPQPPTQPLR